MGDTSLRVKKQTAAMLRTHGKYGDTYDKIIRKLIQKVEEMQKHDEEIR